MALYRWVYNPDGALNGTVVNIDDDAQAREMVRHNRLVRLTPEEEAEQGLAPPPTYPPEVVQVEPELDDVEAAVASSPKARNRPRSV